MAMAFIWPGKPKHGGGLHSQRMKPTWIAPTSHGECVQTYLVNVCNTKRKTRLQKNPKKKWSLVILVQVFLWENGGWWFLYYKAYFSGAVGVYLQPMNPAVQKKTSHVAFDHCTIWVPKNATILQFAVCNILTFHYAGSIVAMTYKVTFNHLIIWMISMATLTLVEHNLDGVCQHSDSGGSVNVSGQTIQQEV